MKATTLGALSRSRRRQQYSAPRVLPPLPPERPRPLSVREKGCILVCRLKRRGWDCYRSMPRYNLHMLRHTERGYALLVYREERWQLLIEQRGTGR